MASSYFDYFETICNELNCDIGDLVEIDIFKKGRGGKGWKKIGCLNS